MIKKLTEKIKMEKGRLIQYDFKIKHEGVAGFCPDCNGVVTYINYSHTYLCLNPDCSFEADINRERISHTGCVQNSPEIDKSL